MDAIEKRARELLAAQYRGYPTEQRRIREGQLTHYESIHYIPAIIAALTPPEGHVVVTRNESGQAVAVTRQDDEGRILSVIVEFEPPEGHVSMDKGPWIVHNDGEAVISGDFTHDVWLKLTGDFCPDSRRLYAEWLASVLNAARPEVKL